MSHTKRHHYIDTIDQVISDAAQRGIIHLTADDQPCNGTQLRVKGRELVNFGSCSYLGLEQDPRLIAGVVSAVQRFGTQFSSSRAYMSTSLYEQLEATLARIYDKPVLVTPTTSLGHQAALPTLVRDEDAIILDHQVHASVQSAVQLLKPRGIPVHLARHNNLEHVQKLIEQLRPHHRHIWYMADGVYSMYGDFAPVPGLLSLLERHEQLHVYFDDAHGMTWTGPKGCGYLHGQLPQHPRVMLAVSLNKAFASAGGALVFPNEEWARKVRTAGPTLIFSGPVQPPMLGAALASARLHVEDALVPLQQRLLGLIEYTRERLLARHLPLVSKDATPIFFVAAGLPRVAYNLIGRLYQEGFYVNTGTFPATTMQRGGVRFTLTCHHTHEQIDRLVELLAHHYPLALKEEGVSPEEVERAFKPPLNLGPLFSRAPASASRLGPPLQVQVSERIDEVDSERWDEVFGGRGPFTTAYYRMLEDVFGPAAQARPGDAQVVELKPENHWRFRYLRVLDSAGQLVLATMMTSSLMKDDLFAPPDVSDRIEQQRGSNPYWLTSQVVMLGSASGEGNPLYLRREHPQWREALGHCAATLRQFADETKASMILMRDFDQSADAELTAELLKLGLFQMTLPDRYWLPVIDWKNHEDYLTRMSSRYRYSLRREVLAYRELFDVKVGPMTDPRLLNHCHELYRQVQSRGLAINTFPLPVALTHAFFEHPECDVLRLHLKEEPEVPVAVMYSHHSGGVYTACYVGLDYRYVESHKTYKQILHRTVERAHELGCHRLNLGFTAGLEKRKVGAAARPTWGYALVRDGFNLDIIATMTVTAGAAR